MMSNEEWDRKVEFLLNQQAQFDIDMRRLEAGQEETKRNLDRLGEKINLLGSFIREGFGLIMNLFKETEERINEIHTNLSAEIKELKESQKLTDEQLRKLITRFDRHLSEDHPGLNN